MNPYLQRLEKKSKIGVSGRNSEKRVAKSLNARLTPASGALRGAKGDCITEDFLIECKSTTGQSIALQIGWLNKISKEALSQGKMPALVVSFVNADGKVQQGNIFSEWVLVPQTVWKEVYG